MILDDDNVIKKGTVEIPITLLLLLDLGFIIYGLDVETDNIYIKYKDTNLDFSVSTLVRTDSTFNGQLLVTTLDTNKRRELTSIDQLMNYINDTGYGQ